MSEEKKKVFLFLDDDAFHPDKIRHPRYYYPLIGANEIMDLAYQSEIIKFTTVEGAQDYMQNNSCPEFISFDNDLMRELEGIDFEVGTGLVWVGRMTWNANPANSAGFATN